MRVALFHPTAVDLYAKLLRQAVPDLEVVVCKDANQAAEALKTAAVLFSGAGFPFELLQDAPNLRWIHVPSAGIEKWVPHLRPGVRLTRLTGTFGPRMAEYVIGYMFAVEQRMPLNFRNQQQRKWEQMELGVLRGKTLGVVGLGAIGSATADLAKAVGMKVVGLSRSQTDLPSLSQWYPAADLHTFLAQSDYVALCLPHTAESTGFLDAAAIGAMKPGSWLINIGRGPLVDEPALIEALRRGRPAGAVLDVFATEPLPLDSPLWTMPNVIVTPHNSGTSWPEEAVEIFVENLTHFLASTPMRNEVDPVRGY